VLLSSSDQGSNKVCRKKVGDHFYPLIDIVNQKLSALFEDVERVQVTIQPGKIIIEYHQFDRKRIDREKRLAQILKSGLAVPIASMAHGAGIMDTVYFNFYPFWVSKKLLYLYILYQVSCNYQSLIALWNL
jgi:DNA (cytosine-5)-methyltransferase 1